MNNELLNYYADFSEEDRLTRQNITKLEFDTTTHILATYLQQPVTLTELGAATGRYSLFYANQGHAVTAVELVPELTQRLKENANEQGVTVSIHQANASSVPFIDNDSQDIVLILGPLYHLQTQAERDSVMAEAHRITKPGGIVAVAYISRFFVAGFLAKMSPQLVTPSILGYLRETGLVVDEYIDPFFRTGYFATPSEIEVLLESAKFDILEHAATDGFGRYLQSELNGLDETQYRDWLSYHLSVCREPTLLGSSNHGLVIAKKV